MAWRTSLLSKGGFLVFEEADIVVWRRVFKDRKLGIVLELRGDILQRNARQVHLTAFEHLLLCDDFGRDTDDHLVKVWLILPAAPIIAELGQHNFFASRVRFQLVRPGAGLDAFFKVLVIFGSGLDGLGLKIQAA